MKNLGNRMKGYENVSRNYLTKRTPVIVRVDGRAFHTLTKGMNKPFDQNFINVMVCAAENLAANMQGFKLGYIQSDEASFLLTDYDNTETQGWFDYNLSKIISISSSYMSAYFSRVYDKIVVFDARAFNIPESDIANYFLWRSKDWERNSLQMYCQSFFSHQQMMNKNKEQQHELLHSIGKNWTKDLLAYLKNGTFIYKIDRLVKRNSYIMPKYNTISTLVDWRLSK